MEPQTHPVDVNPEEILTLAGRLDDAPGFDTPRERFRRFLVDHAADVRSARKMIEAWLHSTSEQSQRALQDTIVVIGRVLGFETTFGVYEHAEGVAKWDGQWRSRHRVRVVVDVRGDRMPRPALDELARSVTAISTRVDADPEERCIGLCIVAPVEASRHAEEKLAAEKGAHELRVVSIRSLLSLADMVATGRFSHEEVAGLFLSATSLDLIISLLERTPAPAAPVPAPVAAPAAAERPAASDPEPNYWLATIVRNGAATADQLLEFVIGKRHVLGVTEAVKGQTSSRTGDWVCFFVPGKGVVGHGRVRSLAEPGVNGATPLRASDRFDRLIRLNHVELYDTAVVPAPEQQQRIGAAVGGNGSAGPLLGAISRQDFLSLTTARRSA